MKPKKAIIVTVQVNNKSNIRRYKRVCYKQKVRSSWENIKVHLETSWSFRPKLLGEYQAFRSNNNKSWMVWTLAQRFHHRCEITHSGDSWLCFRRTMNLVLGVKSQLLLSGITFFVLELRQRLDFSIWLGIWCLLHDCVEVPVGRIFIDQNTSCTWWS